MDRSKSPWNKLEWPNGVIGLTFVSYNLPGESTNGEHGGDEIKIPDDVLATVVTWFRKDVMDYFLEKGFDINAVDKMGWNALQRATAFKKSAIEYKICKEKLCRYVEMCDYIVSLGGVLVDES